jgi:hypothetical protein
MRKSISNAIAGAITTTIIIAGIDAVATAGAKAAMNGTRALIAAAGRYKRRNTQVKSDPNFDQNESVEQASSELARILMKENQNFDEIDKMAKTKSVSMTDLALRADDVLFDSVAIISEKLDGFDDVSSELSAIVLAVVDGCTSEYQTDLYATKLEEALGVALDRLRQKLDSDKMLLDEYRALDRASAAETQANQREAAACVRDWMDGVAVKAGNPELTNLIRIVASSIYIRELALCSRDGDSDAAREAVRLFERNILNAAKLVQRTFLDISHERESNVDEDQRAAARASSIGKWAAQVATKATGFGASELIETMVSATLMQELDHRKHPASAERDQRDARREQMILDAAKAAHQDLVRIKYA